MKFTWRPDAFLELIRGAIPVMVLFGLIHWTPEMQAGFTLVVSLAVTFVTTSFMTIDTKTLEAAGTSKTQVVEAARANVAAGTPGGTGSPDTPGGAGGSEAPRGLGNFSDKSKRGMMILLMLVPMLTFGSACAKKPAVLIGQAGVISVDSINAIYDGVVALNLPREKELPIQRVLFKANEALAPIPDLIIAIDNATKAGDVATTEVDKALAYLTKAAEYLESVNGDLKAVPTAAAVVKLVTQLQSSVTTLTKLVQQVKAPIPKASIDAVMLRPVHAN